MTINGIMKETYYLDRLMEGGEFRFDKLLLEGIDNASVKRVYGAQVAEQETCLFHREVASGDDYLEILHKFVSEGLNARNPAPVVRFADGEYAFYVNSLDCNGIYQQAESVEAIRKVMPRHMEALKALNRSGKLAPLIYAGNVQHARKGLFSFLRKSRTDDIASKFVDFLFFDKVELNSDNYVPFYVVYAYLTSKQFCEAVEGKKLCIINSGCSVNMCRRWFARFSSCPNVAVAEIPGSYVATRWESIKKDVLDRIPSDTDVCLVGAGIGSLLVCVDVAQRFSIPAIDAGHVLNMMNGREEKSGGPRLYTIRKASVG